MNAPTVWPGTDLDSIVFGDEERWPGCEFRECSAEALYVATYKLLAGTCGHPRRVLYCLPCKDAILGLSRTPGPFHCPGCPGAELDLHGMESLR